MRSALLCVLALVAAAPAVARAADVHAPRQVRIDRVLTVHADDLKDARYGLYIGVVVGPGTGGHRPVCVGRVGAVRHTASGAVRLGGRLPRELVCRVGTGPRDGQIELTPGKYMLLVASPLRPGAYDGSKSFVQGSLIVNAIYPPEVD